MDKTTYVAQDGRMTFVMPNHHHDWGAQQMHQVLASKIDHPKTMCEAIDLITKLTPYERRAIIMMATEYEMHNMYPKLSQDSQGQ